MHRLFYTQTVKSCASISYCFTLFLTVKVSFEKFLTLPSSYLTDDYDGDEESEEEVQEG